jgi:hypothetical protein
LKVIAAVTYCNLALRLAVAGLEVTLVFDA